MVRVSQAKRGSRRIPAGQVAYAQTLSQEKMVQWKAVSLKKGECGWIFPGKG